MAMKCECGQNNSIDHSLNCNLGGFVIMRHNCFRDLFADVLDSVCKDVSIEPPLISLTDEEKITIRGNIEEGARLDIACRSFWTPMQKSMYDVRVTHINSPSNRAKPVKLILADHEKMKKSAHLERVQQVEHASFTPLVFATNGAMVEEADHFCTVLAEKLCSKNGCSYADIKNYIRKRLSFTVIKSALIALRGKRKMRDSPVRMVDADVNVLNYR